MLAVNIYGTLVETPDKPEFFDIENWGTEDIKEQYWRRKELPSFFKNVKFDKEGNALLTSEQWDYAKIETERCKKGFYFLNNGIVTYITGKHYFYLQWWTLEDDIHPEFRNTDQRYFTFLNHWENVRWCLGIFRGKKRREGASSQAASNLIYECIFYKNSFCGLISKSQQDSRDTFTDMVAFGYRQLPVFLQPKQLNDKDSVTELVFAHKSSKTQDGAINEDSGHRSRVNYRAPVLNAYDRGRLSRLLADEGGKWSVDVPFSKFVGIVTKTMVKGGKRVGFCEAPSTVNEMTKSGGAEFKKVWDNADQFKSGGNRTPNQFVRYFTPAYDGFVGFIDKYGFSVIDVPTSEQESFLIDSAEQNKLMLSPEEIKMGAKAYLLSLREGLSGDLLEEEIRQNPFDEIEMFMSANTQCHFNSMKINLQRQRLVDNPIPIRKIVYYRRTDTSVGWRDATNYDELCWESIHTLKQEESNQHKYEYGLKKPSKTTDNVISVDGYSNEQGGRKFGSKACAFVFRKFDLLNGKDTGIFTQMLYGRPSRKEILHEQVLLAGEYIGCKVWYEHTADDYLSYFRDRGKTGYLGRYPASAIDPLDRDKAEKHYGFPINPFAMTKQLDSMIAYVEDYCDKIYFDKLLEQCLVFDAYARTKSDCVVSAMIGLVASLDTVNKPAKIKEPLIRIYENQNYKESANSAMNTYRRTG